MKEKPKSIFTAWGMEEDEYPHALVGGDKPITFGDGSTDPECEKAFYTIEACTWEEAMAIYYIRQGWDPYRPNGEATPCPECGALHYSHGSGSCWQCDHKC